MPLAVRMPVFRNRLYVAHLAAAAAVAGVSALPATAADAPSASYLTPGEADLVIELGVGGKVKPAYEGASEYEVSPFPIISVDYLRLPGLFTIGGGDDRGFSFGPSFDITGERDSGDYDELAGLDDVDATYEAGVKIGYEWENAEIYGAVRYGFGGAEGFVGNVGANAIFRPMPGLSIKAGPIASFADSDYMNTYFGVTPGEAVNTGGRLSAYDAEGGLKSAGVSAEVRYEFRPDWFLNVEASYVTMLGDAEDSPIVEAGDSEQFTVGLGVSRRFSLDLFD